MATSRQPYWRGEGRIVGRDEAGITDSAEVLRGVAAEDTCDTEAPKTLSGASGPMGLRHIFDDSESSIPTRRGNAQHVGSLAVQVHRNHCSSPAGDCRIKTSWVKSEVFGVHIHNNRGCACRNDGCHSCDV